MLRRLFLWLGKVLRILDEGFSLGERSRTSSAPPGAGDYVPLVPLRPKATTTSDDTTEPI